MLKCETHKNVIDFALLSYCHYLLTDPRTCLTDKEDRACLRKCDQWKTSQYVMSENGNCKNNIFYCV